jgi:hypothetical protein
MVSHKASELLPGGFVPHNQSTVGSVIAGIYFANAFMKASNCRLLVHALRSLLRLFSNRGLLKIILACDKT